MKSILSEAEKFICFGGVYRKNGTERLYKVLGLNTSRMAWVLVAVDEGGFPTHSISGTDEILAENWERVW